jgi:hypothetical protein
MFVVYLCLLLFEVVKINKITIRLALFVNRCLAIAPCGLEAVFDVKIYKFKVIQHYL